MFVACLRICLNVCVYSLSALCSLCLLFYVNGVIHWPFNKNNHINTHYGLLCSVFFFWCACYWYALGWFNNLAGAMKRQLANYVKLQTNNNSPNPQNSDTSPTERKASIYYRTTSCGSSSSGNSQNTSPSTETRKAPATEAFQEGSSAAGFIRRYAASGGAGVNVNTGLPATSLPAAHTPAHILANLDRRHRSPDPPPRYNRGQSPLLLRKNILELSGQPPGPSPMLNRRYVGGWFNGITILIKSLNFAHS